jgi:hypothetical protein
MAEFLKPGQDKFYLDVITLAYSLQKLLDISLHYHKILWQFTPKYLH